MDLSELFIELQDILKELVIQEIVRMPDDEIQKIKEKYGVKNDKLQKP